MPGMTQIFTRRIGVLGVIGARFPRARPTRQQHSAAVLPLIGPAVADGAAACVRFVPRLELGTAEEGTSPARSR